MLGTHILISGKDVWLVDILYKAFRHAERLCEDVRRFVQHIRVRGGRVEGEWVGKTEDKIYHKHMVYS